MLAWKETKNNPNNNRGLSQNLHKFFTKHKSTALKFHRVRNVNILYSKWHNGFCTVTLPNHIKICPKDPKAKTIFKFKTFTLDHNTACLINQFALFKWKSQVNIKHNLVVVWFKKHLIYCNDHYNLFNSLKPLNLKQ